MLLDALSKRLVAVIFLALCLSLFAVTAAEARYANPAAGGGGSTSTPALTSSTSSTAGTGCLLYPAELLGPGQSIETVEKGTILDAKVVYAHVPLTSTVKTPTFCTDLTTSIDAGSCFQPAGATACPITWLLNNGYGPSADLTDEEAAARQAAIWYFSDNLHVKSSDPAYARAQEIIAAVPDPCTMPASVPVMTLDPTSDVDYLPGGEAHAITVIITQDGNPVANQTVNLTTDFGTLSASQVTTGSDGRATFIITSNSTGTAHVTASFSYTLPAGTRFTHLDGRPDQQVIVLGTPSTGSVIATATKTWETGTQIILHKFSDNNTNGVQDAGELPLSGWSMSLYKTTDGGGTWTQVGESQATDANGNAIFDNLGAGTYRGQETPQPGWKNTTPNPSDSVTLVSGGNAQINFGNVTLAVIKVWKFWDKNGDGVRDPADEPVLDGWQVNISPAIAGIGSGVTSDGSFSFTDLTAGAYHVWETPNSGWCATNSVDRQVTVQEGDFDELWFGSRACFTAGFTAGGVCLGNSTSFINSTAGGSGTITYHWAFGDGTTSTAQSPSHTYAAAGIYEVTLTATDSGSSPDSDSEAHGVNVWGVIPIVPSPFSMIPASGLNQWSLVSTPETAPSPHCLTYHTPTTLWTISDTNGTLFTSTDKDITYAFVSGNPYRITLRIDDGCCPVTSSQTMQTPLTIGLSNITAIVQNGAIVVAWGTTNELEDLGFIVYRGTAPDGSGTLVSSPLIPAVSPGSPGGHSYSYADSTGLVLGTTYYYWVAEIRASTTVGYGPISVVYSGPTAVGLTGLTATAAVPAGLPLVGIGLACVAGALAVRHRRR